VKPEIAPRRPRDPRLDFFRGLAMFIIVIAHVPNNPWTLWIPARFGFSDATEIFVFCSGMASALAFGSVFSAGGFAAGTSRIALRVWQVYWAHIGAFVAVAALAVALDRWSPAEVEYVRRLNLVRFFEGAGPNLLALTTLRYVPNYFDILPMYLVILAMVPAAMALARGGPAPVALALTALWLAANLGLALPAEPWSDRRWFFNPFGWQLLFFTGFAFTAGWLPPPPVRRSLVIASAVVLVLAVPLSHHRILAAAPALREAAAAIGLLTDKTAFGLLRFAHFLALAYLAWVVAGPNGARLTAGPTAGRATAVVMMVGRQSLGVFVAGLALSQLLGAALDVFGRGVAPALAVNLAGIGLVVAVARVVAAFKRAPPDYADAALARPPILTVVERRGARLSRSA
jgi:hypothetical protein